MKPIVKYQGHDLFLDVSNYSVNNRMYIGLVTEDGELWDDITINLADLEVEDNMIFINSNIPRDLKDKLYETGVFLDMFYSQNYNMGSYDVAYVNKELLNDYINETYCIQVWDSEHDRDEGYAIRDEKLFNDVNKAIEYARDEFDKYKYASVEVIDLKNKVYFCKDKESEEFYTNDDKYCKVSKEIVDKYIDNWMGHKELPIKEDKIYCEMVSSGYLGIDNSSGECYVEEFETEEQVQKWLLGMEKDEIIEESNEAEL